MQILFHRLATLSTLYSLLHILVAEHLKYYTEGNFVRRSVLDVLWKAWCWSWNSSTLATSCEGLTHWKRPWCWEGLGAGGEGGWDGWMASLTRWTWVWVNSRSWWWTGRPGMLRFVGLQRVGHDWATELNWTELNFVRASLVAQQWTICLQCRRHGFHPWVGKISWRRKWRPTPVLHGTCQG